MKEMTYEVEIQGVRAVGTLKNLQTIFGVVVVNNALSTQNFHWSETKNEFVKISEMDDNYLRNVIAKLVDAKLQEFKEKLYAEKRNSNSDFYKYLAGGIKFGSDMELDNLLKELNQRISKTAASNRNVYKSLL